MRHTRRKLAALTLAVIFLAACGDTVVQVLRATIAASAPLRETLVAEGAITQELSDKLKTDFDDGADCADVLNQDFKAIPEADPEAQRKKLSAGVKAGRCWKTVVLRQNFAKHPKLARAANIIDGAFSAVIVFYSEPGEMRASAEGTRATSRDEKELERDLKKRIEELKQAMKP